MSGVMPLTHPPPRPLPLSGLPGERPLFPPMQVLDNTGLAWIHNRGTGIRRDRSEFEHDFLWITP